MVFIIGKLLKICIDTIQKKSSDLGGRNGHSFGWVTVL